MVDSVAFKEEFLQEDYWYTAYTRIQNKFGITSRDRDYLLSVVEFDRYSIVDSIIDGSYVWSIPEKIMIAKSGSSKKRVVYMYNLKDRLVIGAMYRALASICKDSVADNCFSYKKGTNISSALHYLMQYKTPEYKYGVKVDIHAYFNSVSREKLQSMINELFDGSLRESINKLMLDDRITYKNKSYEEYRGLVPGSAIASFFANYCLRELDQYFFDRKAIYARYSDDIIILAKTEEELQSDIKIVLDEIQKHGLTINEDKYTYFNSEEVVQYLGLKLIGTETIDISDHSRQKIKRQIHRWCRKGRIEIEKGNKSFETVAKQIIRRINYKNFKCYLNNDSSFGWCIYAFRYINTIQSLIELDFYTRETLRAMKTGKHNKANVKAISDEEFKALGWVSLVDLFMLYKEDYDYYCEIIELI